MVCLNLLYRYSFVCMELQGILSAISDRNRVPQIRRVTCYLMQHVLNGDSPLERQLYRNKQIASCVWVDPMEVRVPGSLPRCDSVRRCTPNETVIYPTANLLVTRVLTPTKSGGGGEFSGSA
jgi:hypothetical protein